MAAGAGRFAPGVLRADQQFVEQGDDQIGAIGDGGDQASLRSEVRIALHARYQGVRRVQGVDRSVLADEILRHRHGRAAYEAKVEEGPGVASAPRIVIGYAGIVRLAEEAEARPDIVAAASLHEDAASFKRELKENVRRVAPRGAAPAIGRGRDTLPPHPEQIGEGGHFWLPVQTVYGDVERNHGSPCSVTSSKDGLQSYSPVSLTRAETPSVELAARIPQSRIICQTIFSHTSYIHSTGKHSGTVCSTSSGKM